VRPIDEILHTAIALNATDIHIQAGLPPVYRVQKRLIQKGGVRLGPQETEELVLSLMTDQQKQIFREKLDHDFSCAVPGRGRFRVNVFRQRDSVAAALRRIPFEVPSLESLGLPASMADLAQLKRGFVLITGAAGHGKSTTIAALIDRINRERQLHVVTIEDPIEYLFLHKQSVVVQRELGADVGSFAGGLRAALREDPDVVFVGEMRDFQTIEAALTAAETGHLVFSTLHTKTAAQAIDRIVDVFPPHQQGQVRVQLANVLHAVVTQQLLVRKEGEGLVVAVEQLMANSAVCNLIRQGKTFQLPSLIQTGAAEGMVTMEQSLKSLHERGLVTYEEALEHAFDAREFARLMGRS
jgi:twitching motility protein PilT